jgi:hypothetical protein
LRIKPPQLDPKKPLSNWPAYSWDSWTWYVVMMLAMLWMWQQAFRQATVHTIAYSEFKQHVASGEVVECAIYEDANELLKRETMDAPTFKKLIGQMQSA